LSAPRLSEMRLRVLIEVLDAPAHRSLLARFLHDPWHVQGSAEYFAHDLDVPLDLVDVPRHLVDLRHCGWLHQRPAAYGLATRLRRTDLELRFPDTMRWLHDAGRPFGNRRSDISEIESRLRRLSSATPYGWIS
ncbi:MAG: hypothetical protein L0K86_25490, partial [Actinomycetia bacterium]|nr:hypothetical protein [Actinomycetes bacterium]